MVGHSVEMQIADSVKDDLRTDVVEARDYIRLHEGDRRWWLKLGHITAARFQEETVRGHDGRAGRDAVLTLYLPCTTPVGECMAIKAYGDEAEAIVGYLDSVIPNTVRVARRAA